MLMLIDFASQTRYTCASALCKIALRLPDPVRFDAYCFLKGLADAAALFPLTAQRGVVPDTVSGSVGGVEGTLEGYRREQELLSERIENGACGIRRSVFYFFLSRACIVELGLG